MKSVWVWAKQIANNRVDSGSGPSSDNRTDDIKLTQLITQSFQIVSMTIYQWLKTKNYSVHSWQCVEGLSEGYAMFFEGPFIDQDKHTISKHERRGRTYAQAG